MKISKLFHWLYAILMMLPVFFIGGRMIYVSFNKNAKDSYYGETINEVEVVSLNYESINSNDKIQIFNYNYAGGTDGLRGTLIVSNFINHNGNYRSSGSPTWNISETNIVTFRIFTNNLSLEFKKDNESAYYYTYNGDTVNVEFIVISKSVTSNNEINNVDIFSKLVYNNYSYLDNVFSRSVNEINTNPLFAWAKDSFLVTPFRYITNLFGMPSDSPITTLLSYWLDVSIIWLCFDVVMYLPLLAHRWIDKGMIE